jgi:zinc finger CCHC domain-containing protein 9
MPKSDHRRQKRTAQRLAETTCFACRENGHAAKDCPSIIKNSSGNLDANKGKAKNIVGICYRYISRLIFFWGIQLCLFRCGSRRHTLSRCRKPVNASNPLPFASCFVCAEKGHLASSCPQNKAKGIYPNGGCCKLCGDTTHLAKNCGLRKDGQYGYPMIRFSYESAIYPQRQTV